MAIPRNELGHCAAACKGAGAAMALTATTVSKAPRMMRVMDPSFLCAEIVRGLAGSGNRQTTDAGLYAATNAARTAAVREWTPSFSKTCSRCVRTVAREMNSRRAISRLVNPCATSFRTSTSRSVRQPT